MRRYDPDELLERVEHEFRVWLDATGADSAHIEVMGSVLYRTRSPG